METELRLSQKLERSASSPRRRPRDQHADPVRRDNLQSCAEGMIALSTMASDMLAAAASARTLETAPLSTSSKAGEQAELEYISREIPASLDSVHDGVARIAKSCAR